MTYNRATLKSYFGAGQRPTAAHFGDLIDAALIMDEEGFCKTRDGLLVTPKDDGDALFCFRHAGGAAADWSLGFGEPGGARLDLRPGTFDDGQPAVVTITAPAAGDAGQGVARLTVGADVAISRPGSATALALDVDGVAGASGRIGRRLTVAADGAWRPITDVLHGCVALEVVAGVGITNSGRFALLRAVAMNAFNPSPWDDLLRRKKRIRSQHAWYGRGGDRLELRWQTEDVWLGDAANPAPNPDRAAIVRRDPNLRYGQSAGFQLAIRSRSAYGDGASIRVGVTALWHDPLMTGVFDRPAG